MNEPFEMTLYARLHTSYRREVWVGYGGKDTLFYMVLEEWWRKGMGAVSWRTDCPTTPGTGDWQGWALR